MCINKKGQAPTKLEHRLLIRKVRMLGKSDGGSAFEKFQPGYRRIRGSGDPLIEPLIFCAKATHPVR